MHRKHLFKNAPRLTWALAIVLMIGLALGGISAFAYRAESQALEHQTIADLQAIGNLKADSINRTIADQRNRATVLSRAPLFIDFMRRLPSDISDDQRTRTLGFLAETQARTDLDNVVLLNTAGERIAAAQPDTPDHPEWRDAVKEAIVSGKTIFIDFRADPADGIVDVSFVAPIFAPGEMPPRALGAVALDISASSIFGKTLGGWPGETSSGRTSLLRASDAEIQILRDAGSGGPEAIKLTSLPSYPNGIADRILHGATAPLSATDRAGIPRLAASAAITGTGWFVVASSERKEALAQATRFGIAAGILTLAVFLAALILAFFIEQRRRLHTALDEMERQRALHTAENQFRAVFEQASLGIALTSPDGRLLRANPRFNEMFGYSEAELCAIDPLDLVDDPVDREVSGAFFRTVWDSSDDTFVREKRYRRKDGSSLWGRIAIRAVRKSDGTPDFFISILEDLTVSKRQAEALRKSQELLHHAQKMEAIGNLTGGLAHDFNNLLGVIICNLDLARPDCGETTDLIDDAIEAALQGADLTRQLLAFARRQPLDSQHVVLNDLIATVGKLLGRTINENVKIILDLSPETWPVVVDPSQLETALLNLANNARDAMPQGGTLRIVTSNRTLTAAQTAEIDLPAGDYAVVEVSDTGVGMTAEVMAQVFEPFFTTKAAGKGTGLGLSMVFGFIKQSGGHVSVESEPDIGTTFRLFLPRTTAEASGEPVPAKAASLKGSGETILAVEDNEALRDIIARLLDELGYRVVAAADGDAALEVLERKKIDLVFSDVVMPGAIDGFALAEIVHQRWPQTKILMTSGFPDTEMPAADISKILSKPYRPEDIGQAIHEALSA